MGVNEFMSVRSEFGDLLLGFFLMFGSCGNNVYCPSAGYIPRPTFTSLLDKGRDGSFSNTPTTSSDDSYFPTHIRHILNLVSVGKHSSGFDESGRHSCKVVWFG